MLFNTMSKQTKLFSLVVQEIENFGPGWQARKALLHPASAILDQVRLTWHYFEGKFSSLAQTTGILVLLWTLPSISDWTHLLALIRGKKHFPDPFPQAAIPARKWIGFANFYIVECLLNQNSWSNCVLGCGGVETKKGGGWSQKYPILIL